MSNLTKRVLTSFLLLFILSISLFVNKYLFLILLAVGSLISFNEFNNLIKKTFKKKENILKSTQILSVLFLFYLYILVIKFTTNH